MKNGAFYILWYVNLHLYMDQMEFEKIQIPIQILFTVTFVGTSKRTLTLTVLVSDFCKR
jgi:hypothetical protein